MDHNFEAQRRETFDTFRQSKGISLPKTAVVDYAFFIEEMDASWPALERALRMEGFQTRRLKDGETLVAFIGAIIWTLYLSFTESKRFPDYAIDPERWGRQY